VRIGQRSALRTGIAPPRSEIIVNLFQLNC
jgi:hypothetical protein